MFQTVNLTPIIFIVATLAALSIVAGRLRSVPYPIILVGAGLVTGFIPGLPVARLTPDLVLLFFLPPLLYRSAWNTSWLDFKASLRPISRLAIGLVFCTIIVVAVITHYLIPAVGWPAAFILGAIVSPSDAVSATSIVRSMGLNKRIVTIIEGESLVNDASALVAYRYAVAAAVSGGFVLWKAGIRFLLVAGGGVAIGAALGYFFIWLLQKTRQNPMAQNSLALLAPFVGYPIAERWGVSGVLTVVTMGLITSWNSSKAFSYKGRTQANEIWEMIAFLLNGIIFLLIGLELSHIVEELRSVHLWKLVFHGLLISVAVILIRFLFILPAIRFPWYLGGKVHYDEKTFSWKNVVVLSWTGMRGVVSIATALALPLTTEAGTAFSERNIILVVTFIVMAVTLIGQGLTLPLLVRKLGLRQAGDPSHDEQQLRLLINRSALDYLNLYSTDLAAEKLAVEQVRRLYELRVAWLAETRVRDNDGKVHTEPLLTDVIKVQLSVTNYKRELLSHLYQDETHNADIIRKLEKEMDLDESRLQSQLRGMKG